MTFPIDEQAAGGISTPHELKLSSDELQPGRKRRRHLTTVIVA
jgi:hypothetical protein